MTVWGTLGRLIVVPLSALIAALAAIFVLFTLGSERLTEMVHGYDQDLRSLPAVIALLFDFQILLSGLTLIPAVMLIIVGEVARIRSSLYYVIGGGLALVAIPVMAKIGAGQALQLPPTVVWQVFATAGFAGGFVYWMLAGRSA